MNTDVGAIGCQTSFERLLSGIATRGFMITLNGLTI